MTDTREREDVAQAQMADPSNAGKEVARAGPRDGPVAEQRKAAKAGMLADIDAHQGEIAQFLRPFGISFEFFRSGLDLFLTRQMQHQPDFFTSVTAISFMEAALTIAKNGLLPDGRQAAIASYKGVATPLFMRDGLVAVLWRTGLVKDINDGTVSKPEEQAGRFEYEEGDEGFIRHRPMMERTDSDSIVAAYCVIRLVNGGVLREVVPAKDLAKIRAMSKSPARANWGDEMHRKAAIRRIMKKMPREPNMLRLLADDEAGYDLQALERAPRPTTGLHARLSAGADITKPGFAPGHVEAQTNPLKSEAIDQILEGDDLPGETSTPEPSGSPLAGESAAPSDDAGYAGEAPGARTALDGDLFPGDRPPPEEADPISWAKDQLDQIALASTVAELDALTAAPGAGDMFGRLEREAPTDAKMLQAAQRGRRKALKDKEAQNGR